MKLTEAMATLDNAGLMPYEYHYSSYWADCGTTTTEGRFIVCRVKVNEFEYASTANELASEGIRIMYVMGAFACFEFSEDIEEDVL